MNLEEELGARFERHRPRLRAVAYQVLGSLADADDAVQDAWLRLQRSDPAAIQNLEGWLTTVVARIALNLLRARRTRGEEELDALHLPDPIVWPAEARAPHEEVLAAESVGIALLVVLDSLAPAERVAFVLHDVFAMPFAEIAALLDRSPEATRQLASRARRRVREAAPQPDAGLTAQREVVDAFFAAGRDGDLPRLLAVLHPDAILRADAGAGMQTVRGADAIAAQARRFADPARVVRAVTVNGVAGALVLHAERPVALMAFTVTAGRIAAIDAIADPGRLARLELPGAAS